jgi:hypothetical protein
MFSMEALLAVGLLPLLGCRLHADGMDCCCVPQQGTSL